MGCMTPDAPKPRSAAAEGRDMLEAQIELAPEQYAAEAEFRPKYAQLNADILGQISPQLLSIMQGLQPGADALYSQSATSQRTSDIADVEMLGPRAVAALKAMNPEQTALLAKMNAGVMADTGQSALSTALGEQALSELNLGAQLDPSLAREVAQATRTAQAARGQGFSNTNMVTEAMTRGSYADEMRRKRQAFATAIDQLLGQRDQANFGRQVSMAGVNQATTADPFQAILSRPAYASGAASSIANMGESYGKTSGPTLFDPFSNYGNSVARDNYASAVEASMAKSNNTAALFGAGIRGIGSLGSNAITQWG